MAEGIVRDGVEFYVGSGNVFADLDLPNPEELQIKSYLTMEIRETIKKKRLTRKQAATLLGMEKEELAYLLEHGFSEPPLDQLIQHLRCLGQEVVISVSVYEREPEEKQRRNGTRRAKAAPKRAAAPAAVAAT